MLSAFILPNLLPSHALVDNWCTRGCPSRSSRTQRPLKYPVPNDRDRTVSRQQTQLGTAFWRTAKPLEPTPAPGCDEPTSRCQTSCRCGLWEISLLSLGSDPLSDGTTHTAGSLSPTFVPARLVGLAVRLPYAFALNARFPTALR